MKFKFFISTLLVCALAFSANAASNLSEMFTEGKGKAEIRFRSFERDYDGNKKDLGERAIGGMFNYNTAALSGVSLGIGFFTANNLNSNDSKGGYDLLQNTAANPHHSYSKLAEYYIQGDWFDTKIKYGAQRINTPFVNGFDTRLLPKTYKGLSVVNNSIENLEVSLYYLTETMDRIATDYSKIAYSYNKNMDDNPLYAAGLKYTWKANDKIKIVPQAWYYTIEDGFDFIYTNVDFSTKIDKASFKIIPSYLKQKAIGSKDGGKLDTDQYGAVVTANMYNTTLSLYYAKTGDDAIAQPWGHSKIVVQQVLSSVRAEETVYAAKVGYDFSKVGVKGLDFSIFYADYDTPNSGKNKTPDAKEIDYDLSYKVPFEMLKGLALRLRYADINMKGSTDYTDTRVYATYSFEFGGKKPTK